MPCATVVFSGDSVFLTALNFRQAAGRAGRRGFDLLGNVIFQGVSRDKICRLLSSKLPDLNGHFPLTTTLVSRLLSLLHNSEKSPYAVQAINSLLSQPRIYLSGPSFQEQVLHHLRFSIEYLRRQNLLDSSGAPINFAGVVGHLYYVEQSAFAFHALLKGGFFHQVCQDIIDKPDTTQRKLMLVLAHLFGRRQCRRTDEEFKAQVVKGSPSIVFLPPLPEEASRILREHNAETQHIFTTYVKTFVEQHIHTDERSLPLTNFMVGGTSDSPGNLPSLPATKIRSSFVALSGHGDEFESVDDLCSTVRSGVFLEKAVIPQVEVHPDDNPTPLNAYLYDFYQHEDITALEKANGVRKGEVWFLLNGEVALSSFGRSAANNPPTDFSLVLAVLVTCFKNYISENKMTDLDMLDLQGGGDAIELSEDDKSAEKDATSGSETTADQQQLEASVHRRRKEKVLDTWDAGASSEEDDLTGSTEVGTPAESDADTWVEDGSGGLRNVFTAFSMLKSTFDTKFRTMWA